MTVARNSLYDDDFYAWTQRQAELLRRLPAVGNELDLEHIAEEIEMSSLYRAALRLVRRLERDVPGLTSRLPPTCPYTLAQILRAGDEDWFPAPRGWEP